MVEDVVDRKALYKELHGDLVKAGINKSCKTPEGFWLRPWGRSILKIQLIQQGVYEQIYELLKARKSYRYISQMVFYIKADGSKKFVSPGLIRSVALYYARQEEVK